MNKKLIFIFLILFFTSNICEAKDSTFVFKIGIGTNLSKWTLPENSTQNFANHGSGWTVDSIYKSNISISPSINLRITKKIVRNASFFVNEKYNYRNLEYDKNSSGWYLGPPSYSTPIYWSEKENHSFFINQFSSSIGLQIEIKHFYFAPVKIDFNYSSFSETIKSSSTISGNNTAYKKKREFQYGAGLYLGYDFELKKLPLFIEYQFATSIFSQDLEQLNHSLTLGVKF